MHVGAVKRWSKSCVCFVIVLIVFNALFVFQTNSFRNQSNKHLRSDNKRQHRSLHKQALAATRVCTQQERKTFLQTKCKTLRDHNYPFMTSRTRFLVDDVSKVAFCQVPKAASSTMNRLLMTSRSRAMTSLVRTSHDQQVLEHDFNLRFESDVTRLVNYTKILVVRNPYSRLLSAFEDKINSKRDKNPKYSSIRSGLRRSQRMTSSNRSENISLKTFLDRILFDKQVPSRVRYDPHWRPFSLLCSPCSIDYDVIIRTETFDSDVTAFFLPLLHLNNDDVVEATRNVNPRRFERLQQTTDFVSVLEQLTRVGRTRINQLQSHYALDEVLFGYSFDKSCGRAQCGIETHHDVCC